MDKTKVSLVRCESYDTAEVEAAVKRSVDLLGGIGRFIKPGEKVLLKPNLLTNVAPETGIVTHPEVLRAAIRLIKPVTKNIFCGDSPSVWGEKPDVAKVYETTGMKEICRQEGIEIVYFTHPVMKGIYPLEDFAFKADRLINIPKFKTHGFTVLTAALKNLFGLVVGMHKMKVHLDNPKPVHLSKVIVDIYEARKPDLNILDGVIAMEGQGPGSTGTLKKMNLVSASADGLSMDMVLARLMELKVSDIPTNKEALARGLGIADPDAIEVLGEKLDDFIAYDFKLPKSSFLSKMPPMPKWAAETIVSCLSQKPCSVASKCKLCGLCQKGCPAGAIFERKGKIVFNRSKCILCLCCQEICPHGAIDIEKGLLLKILGR